jgi:large subunit ribosomal protein L15
MDFKDLKVNKDKRTKKVRKGRGTGSGIGKTSGKGHKGQRARSGGAKAPWFEGGQQRLVQRLPKVGFNNIFAVEYEILNLGTLNEKFETGSAVNRETLLSIGLIKTKKKKIKILANGELTKALNITADKFSAKAAEKIKIAGGKAELAK